MRREGYVLGAHVHCWLPDKWPGAQAHYLPSAAQLDAQNSPWPRTIVVTKTKGPLWSHVIVPTVFGVSECGRFASERWILVRTPAYNRR